MWCQALENGEEKDISGAGLIDDNVSERCVYQLLTRVLKEIIRGSADATYATSLQMGPDLTLTAVCTPGTTSLTSLGHDRFCV